MRNSDKSALVAMIFGQTPSSIGGWCETQVDDDALGDEVDAYWPSGRKGFCEFLGVGESTLSGWLKEGRVPRYAKIGFGLLKVRDVLASEVRHMQEDARGLKIVRVAETHYQLCRFRKGEDGIEIGEVFADRIPSLAYAAHLASVQPAFRLLREARAVVEEMLERTENNGYIVKLENLLEEIDDRTRYAFRNRIWREQKAAPASANTLTLEKLGFASSPATGTAADPSINLDDLDIDETTDGGAGTPGAGAVQSHTGSAG